MSGMGNGKSARMQRVDPAEASSDRRPRRLVVLDGGHEGDVREVLAEYDAGTITGSRLHAELQRHASDRTTDVLAAEWLGPLGWMRYMWCQKGANERIPGYNESA